MKTCPKCGHCADATEDKRAMFADEEADEGDTELSLKDEILKELIDEMQGSLGSKLAKKKPAPTMMEFAVIEDEDDDEEA